MKKKEISSIAIAIGWTGCRLDFIPPNKSPDGDWALSRAPGARKALEEMAEKERKIILAPKPTNGLGKVWEASGSDIDRSRNAGRVIRPEEDCVAVKIPLTVANKGLVVFWAIADAPIIVLEGYEKQSLNKSLLVGVIFRKDKEFIDWIDRSYVFANAWIGFGAHPRNYYNGRDLMEEAARKFRFPVMRGPYLPNGLGQAELRMKKGPDAYQPRAGVLIYS
ncbi:MAG TPA: hypothetical protein ENL27_01545 [Candidatus Parcubacteria bacterium]|nr:hypothetical protein [Candidatus Parcubacteria bacterium]